MNPGETNNSVEINIKLQHWCGFQSILCLEAAPVLEFANFLLVFTFV